MSKENKIQTMSNKALDEAFMRMLAISISATVVFVVFGIGGSLYATSGIDWDEHRVVISVIAAVGPLSGIALCIALNRQWKYSEEIFYRKRLRLYVINPDSPPTPEQ